MMQLNTNYFSNDLKKLQQTGAVKEYRIQFKKLLTRAGRLLQSRQADCFGLKDSAGTTIQVHKKQYLFAAIN